MSDPKLTFSGRKAFAWLARHSYRIGFDPGQGYRQRNGLDIHKIDQQSGYITAREAPARRTLTALYDQWQQQRPDGVSMRADT